MFKFKSKVVSGVVVAFVLAVSASSAAAAVASNDLVVSATLTSGCEVDAGAIDFGSFSNLASTGDKLADSGVTFLVACSSDVTPTISSTTVRNMANGANLLPFNLSLTAGAAADDLPTVTPGALTITQDGTLQVVTLYAKVLASNFSGANALPEGAYTRTLTVDVTY